MKNNRIITSKITIVVLIIAMAWNTNAHTTNCSDKTTTEGPGSYAILKDGNDPIRIPFKMHNGKPLLDLEINGENLVSYVDKSLPI